MVASLWPWIWAEEVESVDGVFREEVFDGVFTFESEDFAVGEACALCFFCYFFDTAKEAFYTKEVSFWVFLCHGDEE